MFLFKECKDNTIPEYYKVYAEIFIYECVNGKPVKKSPTQILIYEAIKHTIHLCIFLWPIPHPQKQ